MPAHGFWRPDEIPPFKRNKKPRRTFVVTPDRVRREITGLSREIEALKDKNCSTKSFTYKSGDILAFFDDWDCESDSSDDSDFLPSYPYSQPPTYLLLASSSAPNALSNIPAAREWIRQTRTFPKVFPLPPALHKLCDAILTVPKDLLTPLLPPDDLPVSKLVKFKLPSIQPVSAQPSLSFDTTLAVEPVDTTAPIPPKPFVDGMMAAFGQALLDGNQSILDPFSQGKLLPLWVIKFWEELHRVRAIRNEWLEADKWLDSKMWTQGQTTFRSARIQLQRLPWNKPLVGSAATGLQTTLQLTRILSSEWLSDTLVDMMIECLASRVRHARADVAITDTNFSNAIQAAQHRSYHAKKHLALKDLSESLNGKRFLYAPLHLPTHSHFVAFQIDFTSKCFCYGDSLGLKQGVSVFTEKVQWWLESAFGQSFRDDGLTLPCAEQSEQGGSP
ncbi:hypothetical protein BDR03DRAFT_1019464 [Suillus americanus]|nr:hypothetical protein BDR03DRAFT_1019464 [Suillus americanus]